MCNGHFVSTSFSQWWCQEFSDPEANAPDVALNQRGQDHARFIILLSEGRKHVFRKNNRNNWL